MPRNYLNLLIAFALPAFGGQSLVVRGGSDILLNSPAVKPTQSFRVEFQVHDWAPPVAPNAPWLFQLDGLGARARIEGQGRLDLFLTWDMYENICFFDLNGRTNFLVRMQKDAVARTFSCELWNYDGTGYANHVYRVSALGEHDSEDGMIQSTGTESFGFLRVFTTLVPLGSRLPTTADGGNYMELKFDGDLRDSSGRRRNASGRAAYSATPNQTAFSVPRTVGSPAWTNWTSLRAGMPAQLDGSASYSLADQSSAVSYSWQETDGPTRVLWADRTVVRPTIRGLIFGTYNFSLQVTDDAGHTATKSLETGAVATDDNGVVINADPRVDALFGPMIAFGKNPWGYEDYWQMHAMNLRAADYVKQGFAPEPQWERTGSGTISYYWNGTGPATLGNTALGTTLSVGITATSSSLTVADASKLDLTELPTRIFIPGAATEEIRVCSASGNVLTVCYDGRGAAPHSFAAGTTIAQFKITGTGTHFLTDTVAPVCPSGASGPPGLSTYSTGMVKLTAGSVSVTGTNTVWTPAMVGSFVRATASHAGTRFVFVAQIAAVPNGTTITLARIFPADADTGAYGYAILPATRTIDVRYPHAIDPTGDGQLTFGTSGCESETAVYSNPWQPFNTLGGGHDIPALNGLLMRGKTYSVLDSMGNYLNQSSTGGINFYGEGLASRALYYRSGLSKALTNANLIDDYWIKSPSANADGNGYPRLFLGGGGIGALASAVLTRRVNWPDARGYIAMGEGMVNAYYNGGSPNCDYDDTRDSGYAEAWLIIGAIYDPDTAGFRARWRAAVTNMQVVDSICKRADSSWAHGAYFNLNTGPVTLTNRSTAVTGSAIPASACAGVSTGTGSVTKGSATITATVGTFPSGATTLVITGALGGKPYTGSFLYNGQGRSASLSVLWPGDPGAITWMASNVNLSTLANALTSFGTSVGDNVNLAHNFACIWNSATSLTLDHPWTGATGSRYFLYEANLSGYGQQPYMLGIKVYGMNLLANATDPALASLASTYRRYLAEAATWIRDVGYDPATKGLNYGNVFAFCEPRTEPVGTFAYKTPGCNYGLERTAAIAARELNAEVGNASAVSYMVDPSVRNKAYGDTLYGALWGYAPYTTGGVYTDTAGPASNPDASNMTDDYIHAGKWYGNLTGMAMAHTWPAVRLGGIMPPKPRIVNISLSPRTAASARIMITAPSGAESIYRCAVSSSCQVTVDDRQGSHWFQIQYVSETGQIMSQSEPDLLPSPPGAGVASSR